MHHDPRRARRYINANAFQIRSSYLPGSLTRRFESFRPASQKRKFEPIYKGISSRACSTGQREENTMFQNLIERRPLGNGGLIVFLIGLATLIMGLIAINQATLATGIGLGLLIILAILAKPNLATLLV